MYLKLDMSEEASAALAVLIREFQKFDERYLTLVPDMDKSPHRDPAECPTWYDWCNCTVETLKHNIERAKSANEILDRVHDAVSSRATLNQIMEILDE